ncbi:TetR family transcriptional regulator [Rhodococcus fascians]|nr:TetR family transcriptional regulator [Rhodococcus fascians]MBY3998491.1 TetR family transcriptional regulator [Rhodococcus fascians]MBY4004515.1 TetR family transcriptional regulator [Rhodococcus fascians]MBY4009304.1 TetR family transcriptional regulator [Rhodococcus fascians]MBY4019722.1 TetR family transcriptional regulator [Rhodococcus fascians]
MGTGASERSELREIGKRAVRAEIAQRAVVMLDDQGFDQTTVEELSAAVGISPRSFFRYFATKEDIAIGDLPAMGRLIETALLKRPADETPWVALRASFVALERVADADVENRRRVTRVALSTPALRAKTLERHAEWAAFLSPLVAARLEGKQDRPKVAADAITQAALACLYVATSAWSEGGTQSYGSLIDDAFEAVANL